MTLAKMLANIADCPDVKMREQMKTEFESRIAGHKEEKLLKGCLNGGAMVGRKFISFGRNICPPMELEKEGFHLEYAGSGYNYCFD